MHLKRTLFAVAVILAVASAPAGRAQSGGATSTWVGTWSTAVVDSSRPQTPTPSAAAAPAAQSMTYANQTLRQIVHVSVGGDRVRVVLTNAFGTTPLVVGAARVALRSKGSSIVPASAAALTFDGRTGVTIPSGAVAVSDAAKLPLPAMADLAIDLYLPGDLAGSPLTTHTLSLQTGYVSQTGNHTGATDLPVAATNQSWVFLGRVEVMGPARGAVVTLGDSITDGTRSTPDSNKRWPDFLARRFNGASVRMGVLNVGISANRLLSEPVGPSALSRFDRDVLVQTGASHVVVLEGINDIRRTPVTAADLIFAHRQIVQRGHAHGLKMIGATLTPFDGDSQFNADTEARRQALNQWIRTSREYDAVVDFDAVTRDPAQPTKLLQKYDSGDHLHPNDAGYEAMAAAIDLQIFGALNQRSTGGRQ